MRLLRRIDDHIFLEWLLDRALNVIIVPQRGLVLAWAREELSHERIEECRRLRNGLYLCRGRLTL